jgi:hypothetical protein
MCERVVVSLHTLGGEHVHIGGATLKELLVHVQRAGGVHDGVIEAVVDVNRASTHQLADQRVVNVLQEGEKGSVRKGVKEGLMIKTFPCICLPFNLRPRNVCAAKGCQPMCVNKCVFTHALCTSAHAPTWIFLTTVSEMSGKPSRLYRTDRPKSRKNRRLNSCGERKGRFGLLGKANGKGRRLRTRH